MRTWLVDAYPGSRNITLFFVPTPRSWWAQCYVLCPVGWASARRLFKREGPEVVVLLRLALALFLLPASASPSFVL
jgi:hypothetical protein